MKPTSRDLMVARVVRDAMWWGEISDYSLAALIDSLPEPAEQEQPASVLLCEKVPHEQRGGYLHAEDDDTPYYVDGLRYCGRCHHFLDEGESHRAAPAPVCTHATRMVASSRT